MKLPLKMFLFDDVQDIHAAVTSSLRAITQEDLKSSFQSLLDRATRCIEAEAMYLNKIQIVIKCLFQFHSTTSVSLHNCQTVYLLSNTI